MRDLAARGFPVRLTRGVLGLFTQAYYAWRGTRPAKGIADTCLTKALRDAHGDARSPVIGSSSTNSRGSGSGSESVWSDFRDHKRIWSSSVRKGRRGSGKRRGPAVSDDYVQRDFAAIDPILTDQ